MANKQGYNKISLIGFLGCDPQMSFAKVDGKDTAVTNFTLFVDNEPFQIKVWDRKAENCSQWLKQGCRVLVEGSVKLKTFLDENNASKSELQVTAKEVIFL